MELYELAIYIIGLVSALVGAVKTVATMLKRASEREAAARDALNAELRSDIRAAQEETGKAKFRIGELETQRVADLALIEEQNKQIAELKTQIGTLLTQMATMQETVDSLQKKLDNERRENERLLAENKRLEKLNGDLFETSKGLQIENKTFREAVTLLGIKLSEDGPETPGPKTPKSNPLRTERIA